MTDYQKMYTLLFNAITDALMQMEKQNYGSAKEILVSAQQRAEELYLSAKGRRTLSISRGRKRQRRQSAAEETSHAPHGVGRGCKM